jgi:hypothetical protein
MIGHTSIWNIQKFPIALFLVSWIDACDSHPGASSMAIETF